MSPSEGVRFTVKGPRKVLGREGPIDAAGAVWGHLRAGRGGDTEGGRDAGPLMRAVGETQAQDQVGVEPDRPYPESGPSLAGSEVVRGVAPTDFRRLSGSAVGFHPSMGAGGRAAGRRGGFRGLSQHGPTGSTRGPPKCRCKLVF